MSKEAMKLALTRIAEGNLGDAPWQANYSVIKRIAAEALAEQRILDFDPFEGDFGMPGDRVFTNRMSIARKPGPCAHCEAEITKGERVRRQVSKFDGELMTHRWCALCCKAMVDYEEQLCDENRDTLPDYEYRREQVTHHVK